MNMNLRNSKVKSSHSSAEKQFFGGYADKSRPREGERGLDARKNIMQPKKPLRLAANKPRPALQEGSEKWTRKKPKKPLPEDKLDYQENADDYGYKREFSQYIENYPENILVHWRGPDYERYPRSKRWYTVMSLITAAIVLYALWMDGIIMAIVFSLIWLVGYLQLSRAPKIIDFAVTYDGILVGDEIFDFDEIKSFWIFYEPPHTRIISLHMRGKLRPYLHIPLHQVDPVIVHEHMVEFIDEEKQEQNIVDILERLLHI